MAIEMNIDDRKLNRIIRDYANKNVFALSPDPFKTVSMRGDISDYIFDVRVATAMKYGNLSKKDAVQQVQTELDATESDVVL